MKARVLKVKNDKFEEVFWEILPGSIQQYFGYTVNVKELMSPASKPKRSQNLHDV